jgi:methylated-DNA-[protein]-cysteine S-methyltransferase
MNYAMMESPVGPLTIAGDDNGLHFILFGAGKRAASPAAGWNPSDRGVVGETARQLAAYFEKKLIRFDLPLHPKGTQFQREVWRELQRIPYGEVISYGELARRIGKPNASRAVGAANGSNPIPIVVPCHRVIGSNGKLTGYGGGLPIKEALLKLERAPLQLWEQG